ncbi:nitrate ABC transporter substrate-binding protein [Pseudofrankia sp. EUN1h]|nr:nitrate ABC transporter substrate-binding protein [Pseudofrankia sp. EUN1h]
MATGAVTALLLSACGGSSGSDSPSSDSTPGTTTVNVGVIPIVDVAPIYLGVQQGFFKAEGLNLKLATAQGGAAIVPGVTSGQYQFGFSNTTSLLLAASKGLPVKALTAGVATTGSEGKDFGAVVVPADSPIHSAADLAGKRVAVNTLNNINTTTVNAAVRAGGGDPSGIDYVELAFPEITPAVAKGDVDAGQLVEPFLTIAKNQGMREVTSNYAATNPSLTIAMYFTSANYAKSHPDVVRRFTTAMNKSLAYADGNPDAVRTVLTSYLKIDPAVQKAITLPKWPTAISTDSVGKLADLAVQDKLITQKPDLSALLP